MDTPAIILGMDALKLFNRVSLDFATARARAIVPRGANADS
jgi:hypothetical protein